MKILDIDINYNEETLYVLTENGTLNKKLDFLKEIDDLTKKELYGFEKISYDLLSSIKSKMLRELRGLTSTLSSSIELRKKISDMSGGIKYEIIKNFRELGLKNSKARDIVDFCYKDNNTGIYNSLFFKRFLSKEDTSFTDFGEFDEYNYFLNDLTNKFVKRVLFFEINNIQVINKLTNEEEGRKIVENILDNVNSLYHNQITISQSNNEYIILGSTSDIKDIEELFQNFSFLESVSENIANLQHKNTYVFPTISASSINISIPTSICCQKEIIDFKRTFCSSLNSVQERSYKIKELLKQQYNHESLGDVLVDSDAIVEYTLAYTKDFSNEERFYKDESDTLLKSIINENNFIDINSIGNKLK